MRNFILDSKLKRARSPQEEPLLDPTSLADRRTTSEAKGGGGLALGSHFFCLWPSAESPREHSTRGQDSASRRGQEARSCRSSSKREEKGRRATSLKPLRTQPPLCEALKTHSLREPAASEVEGQLPRPGRHVQREGESEGQLPSLVGLSASSLSESQTPLDLLSPLSPPPVSTSRTEHPLLLSSPTGARAPEVAGGIGHLKLSRQPQGSEPCQGNHELRPCQGGAGTKGEAAETVSTASQVQGASIHGHTVGENGGSASGRSLRGKNDSSPLSSSSSEPESSADRESPLFAAGDDIFPGLLVAGRNICHLVISSEEKHSLGSGSHGLPVVYPKGSCIMSGLLLAGDNLAHVYV